MQARATTIYDDTGKPVSYVGMNWNVTPIKEAELALQAAKQKAEVASHAKSEFVANISHEIRTPLNATLGTVKLLHNTPLNNLQQKYLEMIKTSGESLLAVLNDILDFSKIEAGHMEIAPCIFNLNDLIARLANLMSVNAGEKDLELIISVDASVRRILEGDALRLQQILVNLVSNAIRFTPAGEVLLKVELRGRQEDRVHLHFAVKDAGIGIAKHKQLSLFDAFTQADSSTTRQYGGTGLGLSIAKRLINLMGGELYLSSDEGAGAEVYFTIDLRLAAQTASLHPLETQPIRVLVVDDNPHLWYWDVLTTNRPQEALSLFRTANPAKKIDLVLLDWRLLAANEDELLGSLVQAGLHTSAARIMLDTTHNRALSIHHEAKSAFDAHLVKPVTPAQLLNAISEALAKRRGQTLPQQTELRFPSFTNLENAQILLAEDNALNQTVARGLLEQFGARVTVASDGAQAAALLRDRPRGWDIILMDLQMPVMDGYTASEQIIAMGVTTPIVAMTAGVMTSEREHCQAIGMRGFIAKPIDVKDMLKVISPCLPLRPAVKVSSRHLSGDANADTVFYPERLLNYMDAQTQQAKNIVASIEALVANDLAPITALGQAIEQAQYVSAGKQIHSLKGSLGNLGAMLVYHTLCELESLLLRNALTTAHPVWRQLEPRNLSWITKVCATPWRA